jgi:hypothetical protein
MKTKYHPILFNAPMVAALIEGSKTQTRRTKGLEKVIYNTDNWEFISLGPNPYKEDDPMLYAYFKIKDSDTWMYLKSPYKIGDVLWVRETFYKTEAPELEGAYYYKALLDPSWIFKWKPSIFMPKEACRIFLKVTDVKVERLNDISEEDAIAEGVLFDKQFDLFHCYICKDKGHKGGDLLCEDGFYKEAKQSFECLWESINGKGSWNKNPFVFVIKFERIEKPKDFI